jgi:hypothetical protein
MVTTGKCPKCEKIVNAVNVEHVHVREGLQNKWHGISLVCPYCRTVLGVSIDPVALKTDIVEEILEGLRKAR